MKIYQFATFAITLGSVVCHVSGPVKRQQEDAVATPGLNALRPLPWGKVNFIHTTDTHGWLEGHLLEGSYNGDLGDFYSFTTRMKEKARRLRKDLFIVDTGDTHDGNGLSDITSPDGKISQPLLKQIPYDLLAIGNHELYVNDITMDVVNNFSPHWKDRYLTSNVYFKDINSNKTLPIGSKYTYFKGEFGTRVLAYGFLFHFTGHGSISVVQSIQYELAQDWFIESLKSHKADIITLIGHTALRSGDFDLVITAIRKVYPTIPIAILGGHTHIRDAVKYDPWAAGIESGRYFETIGFFSVDQASKTNKNLTFARRYIDQNRKSYIYHSVDNKEKKFDTKTGAKLSKTITQLRKDYKLSTILGYAPQDYKLYSADHKSNSSVFHLITHEVLPNLFPEKDQANPPYFILNSGSVRYDIYKGPFSKDNMFQLSPFSDEFYCVQGVPYDIVSKILPILNHDGELMKKRSIRDNNQECFNNYPLTPGLTTSDDFGTDGDDTVHSEIPFYPSPAFIASDVPDSTLIDLIYVDFIDSQMQALLTGLSGKNWTAIKPYSNYTSSNMWIDFASKFWSSNVA